MDFPITNPTLVATQIIVKLPTQLSFVTRTIFISLIFTFKVRTRTSETKFHFKAECSVPTQHQSNVIAYWRLTAFNTILSCAWTFFCVATLFSASQLTPFVIHLFHSSWAKRRHSTDEYFHDKKSVLGSSVSLCVSFFQIYIHREGCKTGKCGKSSRSWLRKKIFGAERKSKIPRFGASLNIKILIKRKWNGSQLVI